MSTKTASVQLDGEHLRFTGRTGSGHRIVLDEAAGDAGPRPAELVPLALAGCTAMDVISILRKKRQNVTGFEMRVHGDRATDHPKVFTAFTIEYVVRGVDIDPAAVTRAVELSVENYCSVHAMLHKAAEIRTVITIIQE